MKFREGLYRTMHNCCPGYRNNNQGIIRLKHWIKELKDIPASILEVGCGNGKLCQLLADMRYDVTGLDIVLGPPEYDRTNYNFVLHDIELGYLPFKDKDFDCCISFDVIEHLHPRWSEHHIWDMCRVSNQIIGTVACFEHKPLHPNVKEPIQWIDIINRQTAAHSFGKAEYKVFDENKGKTLLFYVKKENENVNKR